jgi:hypothetical protein
MSKELELVELLEGLFATPERLQRFLHSLSIVGRAAPVVPEGSSPRRVAFEAVDELRRRGLIDADFFERLIEENPSEAQRIRELQSRWLVDVEEWAAIPSSEQQPSAPAGAPRVLVSYARRDIEFFKELSAHLSILQRKGTIELWHEGRIRAGEKWDETIKTQTRQASIFILLVSPEFLSSDFVWGWELTDVLERQKRGEVVVIPVIVRPCLWRESPIGSLQVLPSDGRPVASSLNPDRVWVELTRYIEKSAKQLRDKK